MHRYIVMKIGYTNSIRRYMNCNRKLFYCVAHIYCNETCLKKDANTKIRTHKNNNKNTAAKKKQKISPKR